MAAGRHLARHLSQQPHRTVYYGSGAARETSDPTNPAEAEKYSTADNARLSDMKP